MTRPRTRPIPTPILNNSEYQTRGKIYAIDFHSIPATSRCGAASRGRAGESKLADADERLSDFSRYAPYREHLSHSSAHHAAEDLRRFAASLRPRPSCVVMSARRPLEKDADGIRIGLHTEIPRFVHQLLLAVQHHLEGPSSPPQSVGIASRSWWVHAGEPSEVFISMYLSVDIETQIP